MPRSLQDLTEPDQGVVMIIGRYPLPGRGPVFDPYRPLIDIPCWTDRLRRQIRMPDGARRKALFLIWQDCCPVHGNGPGGARANRNRLTERLPGLDHLIDRQAEDSRKVLSALAGWLGEGQSARQLILITDRKDSMGDSQIPEITDWTDLHVEVDLWGPHHLMDQIEEALRYLSNR